MDHHFRTLGIHRGCALDGVKKAYHQKALELHPDRNPSGADAFKRVNTAYEAILQHYHRHGGRDFASGIGGETPSFPSSSSSCAARGTAFQSARGCPTSASAAAAAAEEPLMSEAELFADLTPGGWQRRGAGGGGVGNGNFTSRDEPHAAHQRAEQRWRQAHGRKPPASGYYAASGARRAGPVPPDPTTASTSHSAHGAHEASAESIAEDFRKMYERHMNSTTPAAWAATAARTSSPSPGTCIRTGSDGSAKRRKCGYAGGKDNDDDAEESTSMNASNRGENDSKHRNVIHGANLDRSQPNSVPRGENEATRRCALRQDWVRLERSIEHKLRAHPGDRQGRHDRNTFLPEAGKEGCGGDHDSVLREAAGESNGAAEAERVRGRRAAEERMTRAAELQQQRRREEEEEKQAAVAAAAAAAAAAVYAANAARDEAEQAQARALRSLVHRDAISQERRLLQRQLFMQQYSPDPADVALMPDTDVYLLYEVFRDVMGKLERVVAARERKGACTRCGDMTGNRKDPESARRFACYPEKRDGAAFTHACLCAACALLSPACPMCGALSMDAGHKRKDNGGSDREVSHSTGAATTHSLEGVSATKIPQRAPPLTSAGRVSSATATATPTASPLPTTSGGIGKASASTSASTAMRLPAVHRTSDGSPPPRSSPINSDSSSQALHRASNDGSPSKARCNRNSTSLTSASDRKQQQQHPQEFTAGSQRARGLTHLPAVALGSTGEALCSTPTVVPPPRSQSALTAAEDVPHEAGACA